MNLYWHEPLMLVDGAVPSILAIGDSWFWYPLPGGSLASSIARVLQVTIYVTDLADKPDFNRVWKAHFNEVNLPARAAIGVADLGTGVKLELVATAAVDQ